MSDTARTLLTWALALCLASLGLWLLAARGAQVEALDPGPWLPPESPPVVLIGSSLTGHALPPRIGDTGLLGDGRGHQVWSFPDITEALSNNLLRHAVAGGARTVFLELTTYAQDPVERSEPATVERWVPALRQWQARVATGARDLLGVANPRHPRHLQIGSRDTGLRGSPRGAALRPVLREPRDPAPLAAALDAARGAGVAVILVLPPLSQTAVQDMGAARYAALLAHAEAFARARQLPLWRQSAPWPRALYLDSLGHLAPRGRARFAGELRAWYGAQP